MLLALLLGLALASIALMGAVDMWTMESQREREKQLLFAGDQYRQAIERYFYAAPPGKPKSLPSSLEDLVEDERNQVPARHLRRLYPDPITGKPWGEMRTADGFIYGVYSLSDATPIKQAGFSKIDSKFADQTSYQNWVFEFKSTSGQPPAAGAASQTATPPGTTKSTDLGRPQ